MDTSEIMPRSTAKRTKNGRRLHGQDIKKVGDTSLSRIPNLLFLSDKYVNWTAVHVPIFAYLVFQKAAIVLLYVLWQVGVEHKRGYLRVGQLRAILNLDVLALG